jgi:hypothetical protein
MEFLEMTTLPPRLEALAKAGMEGQWNARGTLEKVWREEIALLLEAAQTLSELANVPERNQDTFWYERKHCADHTLARLERAE